VGENQLYPAKPAYISKYNKETTAAFPLRKVAASMVESIKEEIILRDRLELEVHEELFGEESQLVPQRTQQNHPIPAGKLNNTTSDNEQNDDSEDNISESSMGSNSDDDDYKPNNRTWFCLRSFRVNVTK
jgi:hypothetical protein